MSGRLIEKDTPPFRRFLPGDTVAHITLGDGIVSANDGSEIHVTYARTLRDGSHIVGKYDAQWFNCNPRFLFHRGEIIPQGE